MNDSDTGAGEVDVKQRGRSFQGCGIGLKVKVQSLFPWLIPYLSEGADKRLAMFNFFLF